LRKNLGSTPSLLALPTVEELVAPPGWHSLEFISDLHLSSQTPQTLSKWQIYIDQTQADAVFILGDLVEAWVGDDARLDGFDAQIAATLKRSASLRPTYLMVGNRDFLIGPMLLQDCKVQRLADPSAITAFGQRSLLVHGDTLCLEDTDYQAFRTTVRTKQWQANFLSLPLATRRQIAQELRAQSTEHQKANQSSLWADIDQPTAIRWLELTQAQFLVHGHTHRPTTQAMGHQHTRHVLSDWDMDTTQATRGEVLRWTGGGFERVLIR
jgi:UDP-2,3-diacylglucosamine hydrolase